MAMDRGASALRDSFDELFSDGISKDFWLAREIFEHQKNTYEHAEMSNNLKSVEADLYSPELKEWPVEGLLEALGKAANQLHVAAYQLKEAPECKIDRLLPKFSGFRPMKEMPELSTTTTTMLAERLEGHSEKLYKLIDTYKPAP